MALFDLFSPYIIWTTFTFVINVLMGFVIGVIAYRKKGWFESSNN